MNSFAQQGSAEAELRAGAEERVRAVRAQDVEALLAHYAFDVVTFDLVAPLANVGSEAVRRRVVEWFGSFRTPIDYELRDQTYRISGDVAFAHQFTHVGGTSRDGATIDMWFRETLGFRRVHGRWLVTHQHSSVPFEMTALTARLDLKP